MSGLPFIPMRAMMNAQTLVTILVVCMIPLAFFGYAHSLVEKSEWASYV